MKDPDAFLIAQFAKELVAIRLSATEDPCAVAAALVKETAAVALKARPREADVVISDACYGGLQALLMAGHDVSRGATLMLAEVRNLAGPLGGDPVALSEHALEGFARLRRLQTQEQIVDLLDTLDALCSRVPVYRMASTREGDIWPLLKAAAEEGEGSGDH
jgi:hypothetical protein